MGVETTPKDSDTTEDTTEDTTKETDDTDAAMADIKKELGL